MRALYLAENLEVGEDQLSSRINRDDADAINELAAAELDLRFSLIQLEQLDAEEFAFRKNAEEPRNKVGKLAQFHLEQARKLSQDATRNKRTALERKVNKKKAWLTSLGFVLDANGMVTRFPEAYENFKSPRVIYDTDPALREATRIHISGGKLFTDPQFRVPLDTQLSSNFFSGAGEAIYVMTANGNLHVSSQLKSYRHHSSILAGLPVASAGEIQVNNGILKMINNRSGHYRPSGTQLFQVVRQLRKSGIANSYRIVEYFGSDSGSRTYSGADEFAQAYEAAWRRQRLTCYVRSTSNEILTKLNWEFRGSSSIASAKIGQMFDLATGQPLNDKEVITRLKAEGVRPVEDIERMD